MKRTLAAIAGSMLIGVAGSASAAAFDVQSACARTVMDYADAWDHQDGARFAALFTDDATLDLGAPAKGRAAIAEMFGKRNPGATFRHLMSNIRVTPTSATSAQGTSYLLLLLGPPNAAPGKPIDIEGFTVMGEYHDVFRTSGGQCLFAERRLVNVFRRARPTPPPTSPASAPPR